MLISEGAEIIVVACNTATAAAIRTLREEYSIKFIGMEPAIKPAAQFTKTGTVGVLATAGTLKSEKYLKHKEKYASDIRIIEHVGDGFVELVEKGIISGPEAESIVRKSLEPLLDAGADTIVLGCTHYPFLSDVIIGLAGPEIRLIDPAPAIAKHLIEVMDEEGITYGSADSKSSHIDLRTSGDPDILEKIFRQL
jgi:glutamate racemase